MISADLHREIKIPKFLNPKSIGDLNQQITKAENENVRFIILKGSENSFCEGLDIKWIAENDSSTFKKDINEFSIFLKKLQTGKFISIAVISGAVSGGGMGIVCACDHVIASEKSTFSLPEGLLGLIPGTILPALLNRLTPNQIKKMFLTGAKYSSTNALAWGLADEITKDTELEKSLSQAINTMKSCKIDSIGDFKNLVYNSNLKKEDVSQAGMDLLLSKLENPEIRERLIDLAEFMGD